ncbi:MAG: nuclease [Thermodesulfobacteria bacterium]|nr:nuclease [Thermodesulfobacteriota bacterium]
MRKTLSAFFIVFFWFFSLAFSRSVFRVKVIRVIDGDTVVLSNGIHLRYAGINALELHTPDGIPQPFAIEATKLNQKLTLGKTFLLKLVPTKKDRYGRWVGELYFPNGTSVSEELIKSGYVLVCYYRDSKFLFKKYLPLQREVLKKGKGIFALAKFIDVLRKGVYYVGNKRSKRFHFMSCPEARKIKRKVIFNSITEALYQGYCPARGCFDMIFPRKYIKLFFRSYNLKTSGVSP